MEELLIKMENILKKFILGILIASSPLLCHKALVIGNELLISNSPKIESMSHLERLIEEKKKEASFNGKIIAKIDSTGKETKSANVQKKDGIYQIIINKNYLKIKVLDHELYHIFDGHCEDSNIIMHDLYYEPKTTLHTLLNK